MIYALKYFILSIKDVQRSANLVKRKYAKLAALMSEISTRILETFLLPSDSLVDFRPKKLKYTKGKMQCVPSPHQNVKHFGGPEITYSIFDINRIHIL